MTKLLASRLRHKITFLKKKIQDSFAEEIWQEKFETFAEILPLDERSYNYIENFNFGQLVTESLFIFRVRFTELPSSKLRIKYNNRLFEIKKITNVEERNLVLSILAVEII
ncbi:MAG: hypothetical protein K0Q51_378 [Rickettsiaceae bacterium]|jgi:head-tail adaptor|nr:hypothetical protein [Rickettsiaceae bacterium]